MIEAIECRRKVKYISGNYAGLVIVKSGIDALGEYGKTLCKLKLNVGELRVCHLALSAYLFKHGDSALFSFVGGYTGKSKGKLHIGKNSLVRDKIIALKNESD